jgi:hypothetical protein
MWGLQSLSSRGKIAQYGGRRVAPKTFLKNVAEDLQDRYTNTRIRTDGQAVVLHFRGGAHYVDVVPGVYEDMNGKRPMYLIVGASGRHTKFIQSFGG